MHSSMLMLTLMRDGPRCALSTCLYHQHSIIVALTRVDDHGLGQSLCRWAAVVCLVLADRQTGRHFWRVGLPDWATGPGQRRQVHMQTGVPRVCTCIRVYIYI